jgi:hypothetical protein
MDCKASVDTRIKEILDQLPQWNGEILTYRLVFKFIRNELPQLSHSLVNIITDYFGNAPFEDYFPHNQFMSNCYVCSAQRRVIEYVCHIRECSFECEHVSYQHCAYAGSKYHPICNSCWPYNVSNKEYGILTIKLSYLRNNNIEDHIKIRASDSPEWHMIC